MSPIIAKHNRLSNMICDLFNEIEETDTYIKEYQLVDKMRVDILSFAKKTIIEVKLKMTLEIYEKVLLMFKNIAQSYPNQFHKYYIIAEIIDIKKEFIIEKNKQFEDENNAQIFLWSTDEIVSKIKNYPELANKYSVDISPYKGVKILIKQINIKKIKCFNEALIIFNENSNIILGINGRGKTTILQLLALGLTNEIKPETKNEWSEVVKKGTNIGYFEIIATINDKEEIFKFEINQKDEIKCIKNREKLNEIFQSYMILAYGANRGVSKTEISRKAKYEDIASMFNDNSHFKNINQSGVYEFVKNNFIKIQDIINSIFVSSNTNFLLDNFSRDTFLFKTPSNIDNSELIKLEAMPSGFRVMFIWIFDMIWRAAEIYQIEIGEKTNFRGFVLVDEIDKHLHPSWQRQILPILNENFPNVQFVFSTHSPFIVQSLENNALTILKSYNDGTVTKEINLSGKPFGYEIEKVIERFMGEISIPDISEKLNYLLIEIKKAAKNENRNRVKELYFQIKEAVPEDSDYIEWVNILASDFLTDEIF